MQVSNMPVLVNLLINVTICGKSFWRITSSGQARTCHLCFLQEESPAYTQTGTEYPCRDTVTNEKGLGTLER